jgi:signal peptidase II
VTTSLSGGDAVASADTPGAPDAVPTRPRGLALVVLGFTALVIVGIDLLTKQLALTNLSDGSVVRILGGAVNFDLTRNSGAAFSIGSNLTIVFPIITLVVLGGIVWLARQLRSVPWALSMGLIVGGALGNLLDRLFRAPGPLHGHVVDFISVFAPNGEAFPIFNAADSSLFCGVVLAILLEFTGRRRDGSRVRPEVGRGADAGGSTGEVRDSQREDA